MSAFTKTLFRTLVLSSLLVLAACNDDDDDDGPSTPPPSGQISANLQSTSATGVETDPDWSLPAVTAEVTFDGLTITALNSGTGETLTISLPNSVEGVYNNPGNDPDDGFATWRKSSGGTTFSSLDFGGSNTAFFSVNITSLDTTNMTIEGMFNFGTFNPNDTLEAGFFTQGSFSEVPVDINLNTGSGEGTVTATVDGNGFTATLVTATLNAGSISITGTSDDGSTISLTIPGDASAGSSYDPGDLFGGSAATFGSLQGAFLAVVGSTLEVTSHDTNANTITGTFSFEGEPFFGSGTVNVTNGNFDVTYDE
jgi:hypothetical protein